MHYQKMYNITGLVGNWTHPLSNILGLNCLGTLLFGLICILSTRCSKFWKKSWLQHETAGHKCILVKLYNIAYVYDTNIHDYLRTKCT